GETRDAENLEYVADFLHVSAFHLLHIPDAQRRSQLRPCFRTIVDRWLVRGFSGGYVCGLSFFLRKESLAFALRAQTEIPGFPRVHVLVQQPASAGGLFHVF